MILLNFNYLKHENKRLKAEMDQRYKKIGKLEIEKDFLKKSLGQD